MDRLIAARDIVRGHFTQQTTQPPEDLPAEYCDRALFEQLYRRTVSLLRREVQPVPLPAYAAFLARWQGADGAPQAAGPDGLRKVLAQLRGLALPAVTWERDVLPARVARYREADLDALCASGDLVWACSGADPRRARVRFFGRGEGGLFLGQGPQAAPAGLSAAARAVHDYLRAEGASFAADLQAGLGLTPASVRDALAELVLAGLATGDSLAALHAVLGHGGAGTGRARARQRAGGGAGRAVGAAAPGQPAVARTVSVGQAPRGAAAADRGGPAACGAGARRCLVGALVPGASGGRPGAGLDC